MLWELLKKLANKEPITQVVDEKFRNDLENAISTSWQEYERIPQEEKDRMCVELAQNMGCESDDVDVCSKYIYDYAWSKSS